MITIEEAIENNEKLMGIIAKTASQIAAEQAIKEYEKQKEKHHREEYNKRLHNVKLILRNYNSLKEYVDRIDDKTKASLPKVVLMKETESLINMIEFSTDIVGSIKEQSQKTIIMIKHIDNALSALQLIYEQENDPMYFNVLKKRYIEKMTPVQLSELYNVHKRTIYKIIDSALERLSILLFGIYGIKLDS